MSDYIDPVQQQMKKVFRRGGPMDTVKHRVVCKQCGKRITLTLRQIDRGMKPVCKKCGPGTTFTSA